MALAVELKLPEREVLTDEHLLTLARCVDPALLRRLAEVEKLRWRVFPLLSAGFITLVDVMGDDMSVVQAARTSYGAGTKQVNEDDALIRYLMRHRHTTPFEMAELKFLICCPMDLWRQWIRHRMASVNEYSTRYSIAIDVNDTTPEGEWRAQSGKNRQGSGGYLDLVVGQELTMDEANLHKVAREVYQKRLSKGVAREQARKDLPLSTYTLAYWKADLHNLMHFLGLRMEAHAQKEIRDFATVMGQQIVRPLFPKSWAAFERYRLNATAVSEPVKAIMQRLIENAAHNQTLDPIADNLPPYRQSDFEFVLHEFFPGWMERKGDGTLKPHGEREEARATLQGLGLLKVE